MTRFDHWFLSGILCQYESKRAWILGFVLVCAALVVPDEKRAESPRR